MQYNYTFRIGASVGLVIAHDCADLGSGVGVCAGFGAFAGLESTGVSFKERLNVGVNVMEKSKPRVACSVAGPMLACSNAIGELMEASPSQVRKPMNAYLKGQGKFMNACSSGQGELMEAYLSGGGVNLCRVS